MTERLYYNEMGLLEFDARIRAVDERDGRFLTVLDRSAFYPTSGGQLHDTGTLNDVRIIDVIEDEQGEVFHISETPVGSIGSEVQGNIDHLRRRINRCNHTAQHILSSVLMSLFKLPTVSVHLGLDYGAVELEGGPLTDDMLRSIEEKANDIVLDNLPVHIMMVHEKDIEQVPLRRPPKKSGVLRVIRIGELDYSACGGTHCSSTGEVGPIKMTGQEKLRGHPLVKFLAGPLALADYQTRFTVTDQLSRAMTCHVGDLPARFEKLSAELSLLKQDLAAAQRALIPVKLNELASKRSEVNGRLVVVSVVTDIDPGNLGKLASEVAARIDGLVLLQQGQRLVLAVSENAQLHAGKLAKALAETSTVKGGGNQSLAQMGGAVDGKLNEYWETLAAIIDGSN